MALPAPPIAVVPRRLRIAVCVSGQLRGYQQAHASWDKFGFSQHDTTRFVDVWRDVGRNWHRIWLFTPHESRLRMLLSGSDAPALLQQRYPRLAAAVLSSEVDERRLSELYGTSFVRLENDNAEIFAGWKNVWKMHYKIDRAHRFALEDGRDFDLIVRVRPDIDLLEHRETDWQEIWYRCQHERKIFADRALSFVYDKIELGDQCAVGTRDAMDVYCGIYSEMTAFRLQNRYPYGVVPDLHNHEQLGLLTLYRGILSEQLPLLRNTLLRDPTLPSVEEILALLEKDTADRALDGLDQQFIECCRRTLAERSA